MALLSRVQEQNILARMFLPLFSPNLKSQEHLRTVEASGHVDLFATLVAADTIVVLNTFVAADTIVVLK